MRKIHTYILFWMVAFWLMLTPCAAQKLPEGELTLEQYISLAVEKEKAGNIKEASKLMNEAAGKCWESKDYKQAIRYYNHSIEMNRSIENEGGVIGIQSHLGVIYYDMGELDNSLKCFREVYRYVKEHGEKAAMLNSLVNISVVLSKIKSYDEAINSLDEAVAVADELNNLVVMRSCYGLLSEIYSKMGNTPTASDYLCYYKRAHEALIQPKYRKEYQTELAQTNLQVQLPVAKQQHADLELLYKQQELYEKNRALENLDSINKALLLSKNKADKLINNLKNSEETAELMRKQAEDQLKTEQLKNYFLYIGLVLVLVIVGVISFYYVQKRRTNKKLAQQNKEIKEHRNKILEQNLALENVYNEIRQKNEDITRSIDYAEYIQKAFLTTPQELMTRLPDSFIFMKACAIVSGDFFWCKRIDNKLLVACVDCTGHGVPGAFMSLIGSNLLTQITEQGLVSPDQILNVLNIALYHALRKHNSNLHSGMDMAMYCIDYERKELTFSGAKMPLYYIQDGKMNKIPGDLYAIGGDYFLHDEDIDLEYSKHVIPLDVPTWVYLSSDGYQSQLSYLDRKKFQSKRFRNLLLKIHELPMQRQKEILRKTMDKWLKIGDQVDDMLVIGAKIDL